MRRFSQKNQLITLSDINITPLLDLAFVLLIIFIITTPLLEQNLKLNLPVGGAEGSTVRKDQVRTIEVRPQGGYVLKGTIYTLEQIKALLAAEFAHDSQLAVYIRADRDEKYASVFDLLEVCRQLRIDKVKFAAGLPKR
jgi:biopolymer transport protein ExbD